jgi:hypothetical protein
MPGDFRLDYRCLHLEDDLAYPHEHHREKHVVNPSRAYGIEVGINPLIYTRLLCLVAELKQGRDFILLMFLVLSVALKVAIAPLPS